MKPISQMSQLEIGAFVANHLARAGIMVVLSGGAAVSLYSQSEYISKDIDLVERYPSRGNQLRALMAEIGFIYERKTLQAS